MVLLCSSLGLKTVSADRFVTEKVGEFPVNYTNSSLMAMFEAHVVDEAIGSLLENQKSAFDDFPKMVRPVCSRMLSEHVIFKIKLVSLLGKCLNSTNLK